VTRRDEQNARFLVQGRDVQPVGAKLVSPWPRSFLGKPATQRTVVFGTSRASLPSMTASRSTALDPGSGAVTAAC